MMDLSSGTAVSIYEKSCAGDSDYGWPRFSSATELSADAHWSVYFTGVYGALPAADAYPVCAYDFHAIDESMYLKAGLVNSRPIVTNASEVQEGDLFNYVIGGLGVYHEEWTPLPNNTWTEVAHGVFPTELAGFWSWRARGSGIWLNVGRTIVFPTPRDPSKTHAAAIAFLGAGCSKTPSRNWPQLESDVFGFCAKEKGYDSIQFAAQQDESPTGTFGFVGLTEIVFTRLSGDLNCGTADPGETLLRSGWRAARTCACGPNLPIKPLCGVMPFPPAGLVPHPPLCAAQAENASVPCDSSTCTPTHCLV